jgi:hypothetical protein
MKFHTNLIVLFVAILSVIGFGAAIVIEPNNRENLGPICNGNKRLWIAKIDGKGTNCMVYIAPCTRSEQNTTLVNIGSYYEGIITCDSRE